MRRQLLSACVLVVLVLACAGEAGALVQRTFVSKFGLDTNPCSATEPCRTFAAAIAQTQPGGEVLALDTAGYGPVTITQAVSLISPPGVYAGITTTVGGTDAIAVNAGANDVVVLKGLSLTGLGLGDDGIAFNSGRELHVEGLTISGFTDNGVAFLPAAAAQLTVTDSLIRNNGTNGIGTAGPAAGQLARVTIDRTRLLANGEIGALAAGNSRMSVRDSMAVGNGAIGFWAGSTNAVMGLENCHASGSSLGVVATSGLVRVAGTTVTENGIGLAIDGGGSVLSRGNNTVEGNGTDGTFTGAFAAK